MLTKVHLQAGAHSNAINAVTKAIQLSRDFSHRWHEAYALNIHAAALAAIDDRPQALAHYRKALAMNREVGHPDEEAIALEGIGECNLANGDTLQGTAHLNQALEISNASACTPKPRVSRHD